MPTVELSEEELAALPDMRRVFQVASQLSKNEKARALMQEAVLIGAPDHAGPEARIRAELAEREVARDQKVDDFIDEIRKEREERKNSENEQRLRAMWEEGKGKAINAGYTGEALQNLEKFMEEKGIADHEVAISHFERLHPPPPPAATGGSHWNFFDQDKTDQGIDLKPLLDGNDDAFLANALPAALREARGG